MVSGMYEHDNSRALRSKSCFWKALPLCDGFTSASALLGLPTGSRCSALAPQEQCPMNQLMNAEVFITLSIFNV